MTTPELERITEQALDLPIPERLRLIETLQASMDELADEAVIMQQQSKRLQALVEKWEREPVENMSPEWWEEFDQFLAAHRFHIPDRNLDFGDDT
jgi:hypothetical protein